MNGKIVSTNLVPLMHFKNVDYSFKNLGNLLGKVPQIKYNFYLCPKQVRYCMVLTQNQKRFYPICKNPT